MNIEQEKVNIECEHSRRYKVKDWIECPYLYFYQTRVMNEMGEIYSCKLSNEACNGYECEKLSKGEI